MLWDVRTPLLEEAKQSPSLLSDLAGLEQYIAESYDSRSFVELLQNADDAGASRFVIEKSGEFLLVANDGRRFTRSDFENLCRSAVSSKSRGTSIGYRGIGFKSVVGFARSIHLVSGDLEATFSRERTAKDIPEAVRVPLVRIPHLLEGSDRARFSNALDKLTNEGLGTTFVFDHLLAGAIAKEFAAFDPTSLLFLRNVRQVEMRTNTEAVITVRREVIDPRTRSIRLASDDGKTQWLVVEQNEVAIAFRQDANRIVRLDEREAIVHAFLPTMEPTGLPVKIHGDISTDPSRTRVVFDDRTTTGINNMADLVVTLLGDSLSGTGLPESTGIVTALIPYTDPRMAGFQRRCFKTELFAAIQRSGKGRFDDLRCRPSWMNAIDFEALSRVTAIRAVPRHFESVEGLTPLLRFLGAKDAGFDELSSGFCKTRLTIPGAAEVVTELSHLEATKQTHVNRISADWRLWPTGGNVLSLQDAKTAGRPLDRDFVDLVVEKSGDRTGIRRLLAAMSDPATVALLLPDQSIIPAGLEDAQAGALKVGAISGRDSLQVPALSLKRWRSAEQQTFQLLTALGWIVTDVSQQNLGYDIEGRTVEGEEVLVEVKCIDYPGQAFTLTSNEEAVARQNGTKYRLAIVRQVGNLFELSLICDPVQQLKLTRQCRQWVWECCDYPYTPQQFPVE